jgi:hypothetical protein
MKPETHSRKNNEFSRHSMTQECADKFIKFNQILIFMRIERKEPLKEPFNIEVILSWEDWERLDRGETIEGRYDSENKLLIHRIYPFDPTDSYSRLNSLQQQEYAEFNRVSGDIDIYIPHGVLRDVRISASRFNKKIGNLRITPNSDFCEGMDIRVSYPGSLKVVDIPRFYESLVEAHSE